MSEASHSGQAALEVEVVTLFPAIVDAFVAAGLLAKAVERGLLRVHATNPRDFTSDRHRTVDDTPFGGGAGMVLKPEPVVAALESLQAARGPAHTILLTPAAPRFDQRAAERLAAGPGRIALLCGRYEGIDERVREGWVDESFSLGDFVLNGGEVAAAAIIEAVARLRPGVLGNPESSATESFAAAATEPPSWPLGTVLEHPQYTRPPEFRGRRVPSVLLGGNHEAIARWRRRRACLRTWALRPELRPRPSLPPGHPIYVAVPGRLAEDERHQLARDAEAVGAELVPLEARAGAGMSDLKQLCRQLRRRHGGVPWVLGVGEAGDAGTELGPRLILDLLAYERQQAPGPLLLWLGGAEDPAVGGRAPDAWLALAPQAVSPSDQPRLALADALIDISQPRAARSSVAVLAHAVFAALRRDGLLAAAVG